MRAVNLIPAEQRGGSAHRRRPLGRRRLRRARPAGRAGGARAALRHGPPPDLEPSRAGRLARRPDAAGAGEGRRSSRPTPASWRCANSACRPSRSSSTRASTGPTPSTSSVACSPATPRSPRSPARSARLRDRRPHRVPLPQPPAPPARGGSAAVTSATPPGSVPTFTLSGCATSQSEVAQTLDRLRLIDGVSEVTLQSSTKPARGQRLCRRQRRVPRQRPGLQRADHLRPASGRLHDGLFEPRLDDGDRLDTRRPRHRLEAAR